MNRVWILCVVVFGFFTLSLSILDVGSALAADFPFLTPVLPFLTYAVAAILLFLIVIGVIWLVMLIFDYYETRSSKLSCLGWERCRRDEIKRIHEIGNQFLPDMATLEMAEQAFDHNRWSFRKIVDTRIGKEIVGYIFIMPLTQRGVRKLEEKSYSAIHDGLSIFRKKGFPKKSDYYIGALVGVNKLARAKATKVIKDLCDEKQVSRLYAKAATKDGLRVLIRNGFEPVSQEDRSEIGVYFVKKVN